MDPAGALPALDPHRNQPVAEVKVLNIATRFLYNHETKHFLHASRTNKNCVWFFRRLQKCIMVAIWESCGPHLGVMLATCGSHEDDIWEKDKDSPREFINAIY